MRIALFHSENLATQQAVITALETHQDKIQLVVLSSPCMKQKRCHYSQFIKGLQQQGAGFALYLLARTLLMRIVTRWLEPLGVLHLSTVERRCESLGIPCIYVKDINSQEVEFTLRQLDISLITLFDFDQALKQPLINFTTQGVINFHPSVLPAEKSAFPVLHSALHNPHQQGITAHWIENEAFDTGPILAKVTKRDSHACCLLELEQHVSREFPALFTRVINQIYVGFTQGTEQTLHKTHHTPSKIELQRLVNSGTPLVDWGWYLSQFFTKNRRA